MPGPMQVSSSGGGFLDTLLSDLSAIRRQRRHPVYNAAGQVVGSYDTLDALCQGKWFLDKGAVQPPPAQIYVGDFWGRRVPLAVQCVRAAKASARSFPSITQPAAVSVTSATKAVRQAQAGQADAIQQGFDLDALSGPIPAEPSAPSQLDYSRLALYGVIAVLGIAALAPRDSGRGRR